MSTIHFIIFNIYAAEIKHGDKVDIKTQNSSED